MLVKGKTQSINSDNNKRNTLFTIAIFASFLIYGFYGNIKGPALPRMQADFNISELQLGFLLAMNSIGYLIACSFTTTLARIISIKTCLISALIIIIISGVCICFTPNYIVLVLSYSLLSIGGGMLEVSQNVIAATIFTGNTGTMMNLSHFFYGAGSIFSPVISTSLMMAKFGDQILSWRYLYLIVLSFAIIPLIPALFGRLEKRDYSAKKANYGKILKNPLLWLIVLTLSFGLIGEMGVGAWFVNFLEKAHGFTVEKAALQLTLFFVCLTASRLIFGPLIDKIGLINSLAISTAFSGLMIVIGVLIGEKGVVLLVIAGAGVAPIYPTGMALISKLFAEELDIAMTLVLTVMGILLAVSSFLLGGIVQLARSLFTTADGVENVGMAYAAGYIFLGVCCLISFALVMKLRSNQKKADNLV